MGRSICVEICHTVCHTVYLEGTRVIFDVYLMILDPLVNKVHVGGSSSVKRIKGVILIIQKK